MTKKIVVAGCSFATHYARSRGLKQFPIWPELLAKELNLKLINTAEMGASNTEIYSKAIDAAVTLNDIELMVVMWSEWDRLSFPYEKSWKSFSPETTFKTNVENFPGCQQICQVMHDNDLSNLKGVVNSTIRLIWSFQTIMESMDIKYVHIQGPSPNIYEWYKVWKFADQISKSPYADLINNKFIGWPPVRYNAGWNIDDFFRFHLEDPLERYTIAGDDDSHPNELGNQYIYNILKNHYEETYQTN
tara:strand:- start:1428 stop:2165 length:738 start_codon:yes stop_codon:yes gene_type:complete